MGLPADYYVDKLRHMIDWVRSHHDHLVDPVLAGFIDAFERIPDEGRRLLLRLLMRRGPCFRIDLLTYPEVRDPVCASLGLALAGLARLENDLDARLGLLRVPELRKLASACAVPTERAVPRGPAPPAGAQRLRRDALLMHCARLPAGDLDRLLPAALHVALRAPLDRLRLLFFGNLRQDLTEFILADIGTQRFAAVPLSPRLPWTDQASLHLSLATQRAADRTHEVAALLPQVPGFAWQPVLDELGAELREMPVDGPTRARRVRALMRLADLQGRLGKPSRRVALLRSVPAPAAREGLCRTLAAAGRRESATRLLAKMRASPASAEEQRFAERFDPLSGRCRPQRRSASSIRFARLVLPRGDPGVRVEHRVAELFTAHGGRALHMENHLPGMLFLLGFWDIVFAPLPGAFVQPFQAGPTDLFDGEFRARRRHRIDARIAEIASGSYDTARFIAVARQHCGTVNAFWPWHADALRAMAPIIESIAAPLRAAICSHVADDPARARSGFPDLTVANGAPGCLAFWEVKGPGDQLRPAQREWLACLVAAGAQAGVMEVRWT